MAILDHPVHQHSPNGNWQNWNCQSEKLTKWEIDKIGIDKVRSWQNENWPYWVYVQQHESFHMEWMSHRLLDYFENTWLEGGQFSPAMWCVFECDGNRTNNHLEGWHNKFNAVISWPHPNIYQLVDVIREEQAVTELTAVQLEAGSQPPRKRRRYTAVDERLAKLKKDYTEGDKTIDQYIVGVAYNLSTFMYQSNALSCTFQTPNF